MAKKVDYELVTAKVVSFVFNPLSTLLITFVIGNLSLIRHTPEAFIIFFFIGGFFPAVLYLHYLWVHKAHLLNYASLPRDKRNNLLLTAIISFCLDVALFSAAGMESFWVYSAMLLVILFGAFYLLNKFIDKASFHTGIFAFSVLYLTNRVSVAFTILLILIPFIAWSRIYLHKHTWFQLMLGTVIGMFIAMISWTF